MAATDHPLVLDLGKVSGLSAYELWLLQPGNEGKTEDEFWEWIRGADIDVTDAVEDENGAVVTSNGVWDYIQSLISRIDAGRAGDDGADGEKADGNPTAVLAYSLRDPLTETVDDEVVYNYTERLSYTTSGSDRAWTLAPLAGQSWIIDNAGYDGDTLVISLPSGARIGSRINVSFVATQTDSATHTIPDITIDSAGVIVSQEEAPNTITGVFLSCTMGKHGWQVVRHYAAGDQAVEKKPTATIIFSGNNYAATNGTNHVTTYTNDTAGAATVSCKLRTDVFKSLYGAPIVGWTESKSGRTATYANGATITRAADSTLTLYPVYGSNGTNTTVVTRSDDTAIAKWSSNTNRYPSANTDNGPSRGPTYPGTNGYLQKWKPSSYISGFKETKVRAEVTIYVLVRNNDELTISLAGSSWTVPAGSKYHTGYYRANVTFNVGQDGNTGATDCRLRLIGSNNTDFWWGVTKIYMP